MSEIVQVNKAYRDLFNFDKRFVVLKGGGGSGKSVAIAQVLIAKIRAFDYVKVLVVREHANTLKDSCYQLLIDIMNAMELRNEFYCTINPLEIRHIPTGNTFLFRGLDDPEKLKSIVDPTDCWIEEASEIDKKAFTQLNIRVRGDNDTPKNIWLSFNPVDEELWIKDRFFDNNNTADKSLVIETTYKDNKFLDDENKAVLEELVNEDELYYNVYALGKWGTVDSRGLIYKSFTDANIIEHGYMADYPLILTCDFNVDPMKWVLLQEINGKVYCLDELVLPDTDTASMCEALIARKQFPDIIHGDYSGTFRHTSSRSTDYNIIKQYFPNAIIKVKPNPPVIDRINAVNMMLYNNQTKERKLFISPKCRHLINDLRKVKYVEGKREEDKKQELYDGKNTINALVHISSALGYYIEYNFGLRGKIKVTHNFNRNH